MVDTVVPVGDGASRQLELRFALDPARAGGLAVPVIGLTANAMLADRQACLDAGMNDHVGKPFVLDQLVAVLQTVTGMAAPHVPPESPHS